METSIQVGFSPKNAHHFEERQKKVLKTAEKRALRALQQAGKSLYAMQKAHGDAKGVYEVKAVEAAEKAVQRRRHAHRVRSGRTKSKNQGPKMDLSWNERRQILRTVPTVVPKKPQKSSRHQEVFV